MKQKYLLLGFFVFALGIAAVAWANVPKQTYGKAATVDVNSAITADIDAAVAAATGLRLMGYSAAENAGSPAIAEFEIVNGATGNAGTKLVHIHLAASASETVWFGDSGLDASDGISINDVTGTFNIHLYYKTFGGN